MNQQPNSNSAAPLALGVLLACSWFGVVGYHAWLASGRVNHLGWRYRDALTLASCELELRAAGVRKFAAEHTRLPVDLIECSSQTPSLLQFQSWCTNNPKQVYCEAVDDCFAALQEPWFTGLTGGPPPLPPPASMDLFSLPLIYRPEAAAAKLTPTDSVVTESVHSYLAANGYPQICTFEFTLESLFARQAKVRIEQARSKALSLLGLQWGGTLLIAGMTLLILKHWRGQPNRAHSIIATIIGALALLLGLCARFTCYSVRPFRSSDVSKQTRLQLLEQAVRDGEVPEDVAKVARKRIEEVRR